MMAVIMQQTTLIMETVVDLMSTHNIAQNANVFLEAVEVLLQPLMDVQKFPHGLNLNLP